MSAVPKPSKQRKQRALTCTLTDDQFERIETASQAVGLTRSEWARQQLDRDSVPQAAPPPLGPQYAQIFMEQLVSLQALIEQQLERTIAGVPPITRIQLDDLINRIDDDKVNAARSLIQYALTPPLPLKKG